MTGTLRQRQQQLLQYLLQGEDTIASHIAVQGKVNTSTRLHIYRNAYQSRLRETLDIDHPMTGLYLGDELFEQMVAAYREQVTSTHRSLRHYGKDLPAFLATHTPFSDSPQIAELARFERLLLTAFDAADAARATGEKLRELPAQAWPELTLKFHPSVQLFESDWNVVQLWQALKEETTPPPAQRGSTAWLLWRNADLLTEFRHLEAAELVFLKQFLGGSNFATGCEVLLEMVPRNEVSATAAKHLLHWLESGYVTALVQARTGNDVGLEGVEQREKKGEPESG